MSQDFTFEVRFHRLSKELAPYFTVLASWEFHCNGDARVHDFLHPEWASMRFFTEGNPPTASVVPEPRRLRSSFVVSGPTSRAIDFTVTSSKIYSIGVLPAGWARYARAPASELTDHIVDGSRHPCFAAFAPLLEELRSVKSDLATAIKRMEVFLLALEPQPVRHFDRVLALQEALTDPDATDVDGLSERVGINRRALERLCARYFGFPPKVLLRRQRFLRSLARFMLDARGNWSRALDEQYYDQAHFVRDFRSFMGLTPSQYAEMPHPILDRVMAQRMADHGATSVTHLPTMVRYGSE